MESTSVCMDILPNRCFQPVVFKSIVTTDSDYRRLPQWFIPYRSRRLPKRTGRQEAYCLSQHSHQ